MIKRKGKDWGHCQSPHLTKPSKKSKKLQCMQSKPNKTTGDTSNEIFK